MKERTPEISVIVPALNEEKYIGHVFKGLAEQTFKDFETIVADNNSSDHTREIARKYAKVVVEKRRGISRGRNAGASAACGRLLVFLDADTRPAPGCLEAYYKGIKGDVIAATGPILPLEKAKATIMMGYKFVSILFVKASVLMGKPSVIGSNFAVLRSAFEKVNGFDVNLATYEDWDLSLRLRKVGKIAYLDDALVYTSVRRVQEWGIHGFFAFHVGNMWRYNLLKKPKEDYDPVR